MNEISLTVPPTEIELSDLNNAVAVEPSMHNILRRALFERDQLKARLLTAAGDDLCRLSQEEIKAMTAGEVQIPPKSEFLASCERFHAQVAGTAGVLKNCLTLAQLIAENELLSQRLELARQALSDAWTDIGQWQQLARHQREILKPEPGMKSHAGAPTEAGIKASDKVKEQISAALRAIKGI